MLLVVVFQSPNFALLPSEILQTVVVVSGEMGELESAKNHLINSVIYFVSNVRD